MLKDYIPRLKQIYEICPDKDIYLYGKCLFDIMSGKEVLTLDLLVKTRTIDDAVREQLENTYHFNIKIDKNFDLSDENFTLYCIWCSVKDIITLNKVEVEGRWPALIDINKKNIRFTEKGKNDLSSNPNVILDALLLACDNGYAVEIATMKHILTHLQGFGTVESRKIYHFLREVFVKSEKPRKSISLINTLGLSKELFGRHLVESSIVNNLNKKDVFEYFTIIFDDVPKNDLEQFLVEKVGFHLRDANHILTISKIIELFVNTPVRDVFLAHTIIEMYGKDKISSAIRLFRSMGFNDFANIIKKERYNIVALTEMSLTIDTLMNTFLVDEEEAKKLFAIAKNLCIVNPSLMNNNTTLLIELNKSLNNLHINH
jgi:hypothetical protein